MLNKNSSINASAIERLQSLWYKLPVRQRGAIIIAIPVTCLISTLAVFAWLKHHIGEAQHHVEHTQGVQIEAKNLLAALVNAETGVRGYEITGRSDFLEPYEQAIAIIPNSLKRLSNLVQDNPSQAQQVREIEARTQQTMNFLKNNLDTLNPPGTKAPQLSRMNDFMIQGKSLMDATRKEIDIFLYEEERLLDERQKNLDRKRQIAEVMLRIQTIAGILGALLAAHLFNSLDRELASREADLRESAIAARTQAQKLAIALQELKQTQSQLIQSEKMSSLGQMVAGVAHEINNPVNFIHGNITHVSGYMQDLLDLVTIYQQRYPDPEIQKQAEAMDLDFLCEDLPKTLSSMKIGTERIRQIVLSLRNFSRLDESDKKLVDIHESIDNTLLLLQHRLKATAENPSIEIHKEYGDLPLVECYAGQLNQVFMNILSNAIDALENKSDSPRITIRTNVNHQPVAESNPESPNKQAKLIQDSRFKIQNSSVAIAIADNGSGIPEDVMEKIFDPFFTTKPVGKGTGLGLSISYQIVVNKHGGVLKCLSTPGQGTEFLVEIPVTPSC